MKTKNVSSGTCGGSPDIVQKAQAEGDGQRAKKRHQTNSSAKGKTIPAVGCCSAAQECMTKTRKPLIEIKSAFYGQMRSCSSIVSILYKPAKERVCKVSARFPYGTSKERRQRQRTPRRRFCSTFLSRVHNDDGAREPRPLLARCPAICCRVAASRVH